jgi:hypothetical protein
MCSPSTRRWSSRENVGAVCMFSTPYCLSATVSRGDPHIRAASRAGSVRAEPVLREPVVRARHLPASALADREPGPALEATVSLAVHCRLRVLLCDPPLREQVPVQPQDLESGAKMGRFAAAAGRQLPKRAHRWLFSDSAAGTPRLDTRQISADARRRGARCPLRLRRPSFGCRAFPSGRSAPCG